MQNLTQKKCIPCEAGGPSLPETTIQEYLKVVSGWSLNQTGHLTKSWKFKDFKTALDFVNKVGALAEAEGHHPNITFTWGQVDIELWTHAVNGLSENDFILASKIDVIKG